jgi:AbrB family looped-hinge helix DNA binding protein
LTFLPQVILLPVIHLTEGKVMKVTIKGQVTIPQVIREKLGITPATEIDFIEENDRVYLVKKKGTGIANRRFRNLRGISKIKMTTDEIMALTREYK